MTDELHGVPQVERPEAKVETPEDAGYAVPEEFQSMTVPKLANLLAVGGVKLPDIETIERLCHLGRHARFKRLEAKGVLLVMVRGRIIDVEA